MNTKRFATFLITSLMILSSCTMPSTQIPATPTFLALPTSTLVIGTPPTLSLTPGATTPLPVGSGTAPANPVSICNDGQVNGLVDTFKSAILKFDGQLLSTVVSPSRGMDVAYFRDGTVITYKPEHARFLFETTFVVDWGAEPGSGAMKSGSFHDVVVPALVSFLNKAYTLHCNELVHGGATYEMEWPYQGEFYSLHFPGTQANGNMDWQTWVMGIEYASGKPYIYALIQYFWEP